MCTLGKVKMHNSHRGHGTGKGRKKPQKHGHGEVDNFGIEFWKIDAEFHIHHVYITTSSLRLKGNFTPEKAINKAAGIHTTYRLGLGLWWDSLASGNI